MATTVRGERRPFGLIRNDVSGLAQTRSQVGGQGVCRWKMLMNGMHLEGEWNCVEYVVIEPGASVGEHVHLRTEEIYYIISGHAVVTMDGARIDARPGDLITTPIGSSHAIANHGDQDMRFFVTEVFPGTGPAAAPARIHVPDLLVDRPAGRGAQIDLTEHFTGDWRRFQLREVPPSGRADDLGIPEHSSTVIYLLDGEGAVLVDGEPFAGAAGLSVAAPPGARVMVQNTDSSVGLRFIVVEVEAR